MSWGLVLLSLWLALRSTDEPGKLKARLTWAWLAMTFSILIKPQGALVAVVLFAFAFASADPEVRRQRIRATGIGLCASLVLTLAVAALFHPTANPVGLIGWLFDRYRIVSAVYDYNTVNAFNLYAIKQSVLAIGSDRAPAVRHQRRRSDVDVGSSLVHLRPAP